jgi:serine protease Do
MLQNPEKTRKFLTLVAVVVVILAALSTGAIADRMFGIKPLDYIVPRSDFGIGGTRELDQTVLKEESIVIDVAEKVSPSVVTVTIQTPRRRVLEFNPFGGGLSQRFEGGFDQDIGSGFIVSDDGLIITNRHVVSDENVSYKVVTKDDKEYEVKQISRDPSNDIAILKIDPSAVSGQALQPIELGNSSDLRVGQFVVAIGTALGEFRHTVTTGVISGLGRGITAGSAFEGYVERLDNVIQTDAAINPGNSGGPLLNSAGQVIGVNVAVASGAENIGFAIPINIVKDGLDQFKATGKFVSKPFLGVNYQMINSRTAILNEVPEGAFIVEVISGSPAETAGIQPDDIITKFDGKNVRDEDGSNLADLIASKKPGDRVDLELWRDGETVNLSATLSDFSE